MTELIKLRPLKTVKPRRRRSHKRSYTFRAGNASSDSSSDDDDNSSSNDESPLVFQLPSKTSKRKNKIQTLPIIINAQSVKQKKKHHQPPIQQFLINNQPPSPKKKEIVINQLIEPPLYPPSFPYEPILARTPSFSRIIERDPYMYPRAYTPDFYDDYPYSAYSFREPRMRRVIRVPPTNSRSVHLPQHAKKLVNRFLNGMEHAHGCRQCDGNDSDCGIDGCTVCRRLRSAMDGGTRRSSSDIGLYRGSRILFERQDPHRHYHDHSSDCKVCNLLEKSDFVISTTKDYPTSSTKKRGKHVHVVESYPSNIKPAVETTTTTTTTTQPKVVANPLPTVIPTIPIQSSYYPMTYSNYVDPNTGLAYSYDPNWQYDPSGTGVTYNYSPYYTNPGYVQSNLQYDMYNTTVPVVADSSIPLTQQQQQQHIQTTTMVSPNSLIDKGTYTHMRSDRKKRKPVNKTVVVHTSRNPTPPTPKIIIEQPRPSRLPRKLQSTTILKERTTQTPHRSTTTYIET